MTEVQDLHGQDSDEGSEEVVLTPAELIERLEQVSTPNRTHMSRVCNTRAQKRWELKICF